jgi:WD40 repeat protein
LASYTAEDSSWRIVTGSWDNTVRIWDALEGLQIACLEGHTQGVTSIAIFYDEANSPRIVSGSWDNTVRIWDARRGAELACLTGHHYCVISVATYLAECRVASGSWDNTVRIWDPHTGECLEVVKREMDAAAVAQKRCRKPEAPAWSAAHSQWATAVVNQGGAAIAWAPPFDDPISHPDGTLWAGARGSDLILYRLEKSARPLPRA